MSLLKSIIEAQGGDVLKQLASNFNLRPEQAGAAVSQLLPALTGGMKQNMAKPEGLEGLMKALQGGNHARYLENPQELVQPKAVEDGNGILGHLLGSKEVSRQVAAQASQNTGIDISILKKMLPMVAAMTMGGMSKQAQSQAPQQGGGFGDLLGKMTGAASGAASQGAAATAGMAGMFTKFLDADNDGNVLDDVMGFAKKLL